MDEKAIKSALIALKQNREYAMMGDKLDIFQLEVEVLYWSLQPRFNDKAIARKLGSESYKNTVYSVRRGIYQHFARYPFNIQLSDSQQRAEVAGVLETALGRPPKFEPWPPESLKEVGPTMLITKPPTAEEPNPRPELRYLPIVYVPPEPPPPPPVPIVSPTRLWVVIGFAIFLGTIYGLVTWVNNKIGSIPPSTITGIVDAIPNEPLEPLPALAVDTPTPAVIIETVEVTVEKVITATPQPTPIGPTPTPTNTFTPEPTDTPTPTATPVVVEPYFTDFSNGLDDKWTIEDGNPVVYNGALTTEGPSWLFIGDPNWTDYVVEFDGKVASGSPRISYTAVGVRADGVANMVGFRWKCCTGWMAIKNGNNWEDKQDLSSGDLTDDFKKFTITVEGNIYTVKVAGLAPIELYYSGRKKGHVALFLEDSTEIDNFSIRPIEE